MISIKIKYRLFILMLVMFSFNTICPQESVQRDSSSIDVRYFKDDIQERYGDEDFNYTINDTGGVNLIQRVFRKFFGFLGDLFGIDIDFLDYQTLEYIVYSLMAVGALYLLLNFLMQNPMERVFTPEDAEIEGFNFIEEDITEINFDNLITDAVKNNNYRLATRYLYLKTLKSLAKRGTIEWHFDKTNSDYLNEITNLETKMLFKRISYIYDYVWYGEFVIDKTMYDKNQKDFNRLSKI